MLVYLGEGDTLALHCENCMAGIYATTFCVSLATFDIVQQYSFKLLIPCYTDYYFVCSFSHNYLAIPCSLNGEVITTLK